MTEAAVDPPEDDRRPTVISLDEYKAQAWKSKFGAFFLGHLDDEAEEHEWIVDGLFSVGDRSVIGGHSQCGKSFFAVHVGMCVAHGFDVFGLKTKKGLVIYQIGEGRRGFRKRLRAWRKHHNVEFADATPFVPLTKPIDLYSADGDTKALIEEINAIAGMFPDLPLLMVFIDTLATATVGADENGARDMGIVLRNVALISEQCKTHVCLVHHMNAGGSKLRGSTSVPGNVDQTVIIVRDETTKIRTLSLGKQRDDEDDLTLRFELPSIVTGYDQGRQKPITSCVCVPIGTREAVRKAEETKGFALKDEERAFMEAFFAAEKKSGIPVPTGLDVPVPVRSVVDYEAVKDAYAAKRPDNVVAEPPKDGETEADANARKANRERQRRRRLTLALDRITKPLADRFAVIGFRTVGDVNYVFWSGRPLRGFANTQPPEPARPDDAIPF